VWPKHRSYRACSSPGTVAAACSDARCARLTDPQLPVRLRIRRDFETGPRRHGDAPPWRTAGTYIVRSCMNAADKKRLLREMLFARRFEERCYEAYVERKIGGFL